MAVSTSLVIPDLTGSQSDFPINIEYLSKSHIKATVNGVDAPFTFLNTYLLRLDVAPVGELRIFRETPIDEPFVTYNDGSVLLDDDLNSSFLQILFNAQERGTNTLLLGSTGHYDFGSLRAENLGDPVNPQDAVTKNWVETTSQTFVSQSVAAKNASEGARDTALGYRDISLQYRNEAKEFRDQAEDLSGPTNFYGGTMTGDLFFNGHKAWLGGGELIFSGSPNALDKLDHVWFDDNNSSTIDGVGGNTYHFVRDGELRARGNANLAFNTLYGSGGAYFGARLYIDADTNEQISINRNLMSDDPWIGFYNSVSARSDKRHGYIQSLSFGIRIGVDGTNGNTLDLSQGGGISWAGEQLARVTTSSSAIPVGTPLLVRSEGVNAPRGAVVTVRLADDDNGGFRLGGTGDPLTGRYQAKGGALGTGNNDILLVQKTADV